jgi:hypothetical protein
MDDSAGSAELPANYRAILQIVQLPGWHIMNKLAESDNWVVTEAK